MNSKVKKKICILAPSHTYLDVRVFDKEAHSLINEGYNVVLITQHAKDENIDGIYIISLKKPKNRFYRMFLLNLKVSILAIKQKADIYHIHSPELLLSGIFFKYFFKSKIIYDVHEDFPQAITSKYWIPKILRFFVSSIFNFFEKWFSKKYDYIIAAWPQIEEKFRNAGISKVGTVTNYAYLKNFDLKFQKPLLRSADNKIVYMGILSKIRGIKEVVQALKYLRVYNIKLVLIGRFDEKKFEEDLVKTKEWNFVEYKGWFPDIQDGYRELLKADIGIDCSYPEPNRINAIVNKTFEYMAAGLPIIISEFPLWKKVVDENKCGLTVNPLRPKEIADAIRWMFDHPKQMKEMGDNGKKAVIEKYNWENESKKLLKIYEALQ